MIAQELAHRFLNEERDAYEYICTFSDNSGKNQTALDIVAESIIREPPSDKHVMLVLIYACSALDRTLLNRGRFVAMLEKVDECKNMSAETVAGLCDTIRNYPNRMVQMDKTRRAEKLLTDFQRDYGKYLLRSRLQCKVYLIGRNPHGISESHLTRMEHNRPHNSPLDALSALKVHIALAETGKLPNYSVESNYGELTEPMVQSLIDRAIRALTARGILTEVPGPVHIRHKEAVPCTDATSAGPLAGRDKDS